MHKTCIRAHKIRATLMRMYGEPNRAGAIGMGIEASLTTRSARLSSDVVLVKYGGSCSMSTEGSMAGSRKQQPAITSHGQRRSAERCMHYPPSLICPSIAYPGLEEQ